MSPTKLLLAKPFPTKPLSEEPPSEELLGESPSYSHKGYSHKGYSHKEYSRKEPAEEPDSLPTTRPFMDSLLQLWIRFSNTSSVALA